jgi:SP family general alpha glucoside:H+ symporter-like MFS transporter
MSSTTGSVLETVHRLIMYVQLGNFYGQPAFQARFGVLQANGAKIIPNQTQVGLTNTTACGSLVGLILTGTFQERFGARRTFFGGMGLMIATIFIAVFAIDLNMLFAAEFFMGIPWGMFQTLTTAYAIGESAHSRLMSRSAG